MCYNLSQVFIIVMNNNKVRLLCKYELVWHHPGIANQIATVLGTAITDIPEQP